MSEQALATLSDIATEVHTRVQQNFADINPVVSVRRNMRDSGVPVDAMTIDCSKSDKRIILVLHDHQPDIISYQFTFKDIDPNDKFDEIRLKEFTADMVYDWIKSYFSKR